MHNEFQTFNVHCFLVCYSQPGAAGLRGSPVPPQLKQISLYCSSLQRLSWQLESYPGWKKTENREQAQHKSQQTLLSPHWQDIYSQFPAQTPCILSSLVCWCGHLLGHSMVTLTKSFCFPSLCMQSGLLLQRCSILTRSCLLLRWC